MPEMPGIGDARRTSPAAAVSLRWIARVVLLLWAAWWVAYGATALSRELPLEGFGLAQLQTVAMMLAILLLLLISWRWEMVGASLLLLAAIFAFVRFDWYSWTRLVTLELPPLVAALLLFWWRALTRPR
jgi:hypothetical protein